MSVKGRIVVNEYYCKGCQLCEEACPNGVIAMAEHLNAKGFHPAAMINDGCTGCGICSLVCPEAAITVYRTLNPAASEKSEAKS